MYVYCRTDCQCICMCTVRLTITDIFSRVESPLGLLWETVHLLQEYMSPSMDKPAILINFFKMEIFTFSADYGNFNVFLHLSTKKL